MHTPQSHKMLDTSEVVQTPIPKTYMLLLFQGEDTSSDTHTQVRIALKPIKCLIPRKLFRFPSLKHTCYYCSYDKTHPATHTQVCIPLKPIKCLKPQKLFRFPSLKNTCYNCSYDKTRPATHTQVCIPLKTITEVVQIPIPKTYMLLLFL